MQPNQNEPPAQDPNDPPQRQPEEQRFERLIDSDNEEMNGGQNQPQIQPVQPPVLVLRDPQQAVQNNTSSEAQQNSTSNQQSVSEPVFFGNFQLSQQQQQDNPGQTRRRRPAEYTDIDVFHHRAEEELKQGAYAKEIVRNLHTGDVRNRIDRQHEHTGGRNVQFEYLRHNNRFKRMFTAEVNEDGIVNSEGDYIDYIFNELCRPHRRSLSLNRNREQYTLKMLIFEDYGHKASFQHANYRHLFQAIINVNYDRFIPRGQNCMIDHDTIRLAHQARLIRQNLRNAGVNVAVTVVEPDAPLRLYTAGQNLANQLFNRPDSQQRQQLRRNVGHLCAFFGDKMFKLQCTSEVEPRQNAIGRRMEFIRTHSRYVHQMTCDIIKDFMAVAIFCPRSALQSPWHFIDYMILNLEEHSPVQARMFKVLKIGYKQVDFVGHAVMIAVIANLLREFNFQVFTPQAPEAFPKIDYVHNVRFLGRHRSPNPPQDMTERLQDFISRSVNIIQSATVNERRFIFTDASGNGDVRVGGVFGRELVKLDNIWQQQNVLYLFLNTDNESDNIMIVQCHQFDRVMYSVYSQSGAKPGDVILFNTATNSITFSDPSACLSTWPIAQVLSNFRQEQMTSNFNLEQYLFGQDSAEYMRQINWALQRHSIVNREQLTTTQAANILIEQLQLMTSQQTVPLYTNVRFAIEAKIHYQRLMMEARKSLRKVLPGVRSEATNEQKEAFARMAALRQKLLDLAKKTQSREFLLAIRFVIACMHIEFFQEHTKPEHDVAASADQLCWSILDTALGVTTSQIVRRTQRPVTMNARDNSTVFEIDSEEEEKLDRAAQAQRPAQSQVQITTQVQSTQQVQEAPQVTAPQARPIRQMTQQERDLLLRQELQNREDERIEQRYAPTQEQLNQRQANTFDRVMTATVNQQREQMNTTQAQVVRRTAAQRNRVRGTDAEVEARRQERRRQRAFRDEQMRLAREQGIEIPDEVRDDFFSDFSSDRTPSSVSEVSENTLKLHNPAQVLADLQAMNEGLRNNITFAARNFPKEVIEEAMLLLVSVLNMQEKPDLQREFENQKAVAEALRILEWIDVEKAQKEQANAHLFEKKDATLTEEERKQKMILLKQRVEEAAALREKEKSKASETYDAKALRLLRMNKLSPGSQLRLGSTLAPGSLRDTNQQSTQVRQTAALVSEATLRQIRQDITDAFHLTMNAERTHYDDFQLFLSHPLARQVQAGLPMLGTWWRLIFFTTRAIKCCVNRRDVMLNLQQVTDMIKEVLQEFASKFKLNSIDEIPQYLMRLLNEQAPNQGSNPQNQPGAGQNNDGKEEEKKE